MTINDILKRFDERFSLPDCEQQYLKAFLRTAIEATEKRVRAELKDVIEKAWKYDQLCK